MALFGERVEAGVDEAEIVCALKRAKAAGYFLLHFGHADGALSDIVGELDGKITYEEQYRIGMLAQAAQRIEGNGLLLRPRLPTELRTSGGIELLSLAQNRIVKRAQGVDIGGAELDFFCRAASHSLLALSSKSIIDCGHC